MPFSSNSMVGTKYKIKFDKKIITFTCRLRLTLFSHFGIKVRILQIIVYIEDVRYII